MNKQGIKKKLTSTEKENQPHETAQNLTDVN